MHMEMFLSHNLLWIVLATGAIVLFTFLLTRSYAGHRAIFGGGAQAGDRGLLSADHSAHGGGCCGGKRAEQNRGQAPADAAGAIDPVSRRPVDPAHALSSVYGGRAYYFESVETRAKFEAAPSTYASSQPEQQQSSRRHGCC